MRISRLIGVMLLGVAGIVFAAPKEMIAVAAVLIVFVLGALAAGYWWGAKQSAATASVPAVSGM